MERPMVGAEGAGQRAQPVGVGDREIGVLRKRSTPGRRYRPLRGRLQREPFVEHQRIVVEAVVEGVERRLRVRARRATPGRRARPGGRSYCRRGRTAPWPASRRLRRIGGREQAKRDGAQPANALGVRRKIVAGSTPSLRCAASRASPSAEPIACAQRSRAAWIASGSTTSMRSAIRLSDGSRIASALNAGSSALDLSVAAIAAITGSASTVFAARTGDERAHHQFLNRFEARERIGVGLRQPLELARRGARLRR